MKAEQRKELETNTLADKMGQTMQRVKAGSRRTALIYFIIMLGLAIALFLGYRYYSISKQESSEQWVKLYDASPGYLRYLGTREGDTPAGKAARLQEFWIVFWQDGIKRLGTDQRGAVNVYKILDRAYKDLAETCKDEPLFEAQALLGQAVVVECWAVQDQVHLKRAQTLYEALADKHPTLAEGKFAKERFDLMKDPNKVAELRDIYVRLQQDLMVPAAERAPLPPLGHPELEPRLEPKDDPKVDPKK